MAAGDVFGVGTLTTVLGLMVRARHQLVAEQTGDRKMSFSADGLTAIALTHVFLATLFRRL